jgi:hypothetical protein
VLSPMLVFSPLKTRGQRSAGRRPFATPNEQNSTSSSEQDAHSGKRDQRSGGAPRNSKSGGPPRRPRSGKSSDKSGDGGGGAAESAAAVGFALERKKARLRRRRKFGSSIDPNRTRVPLPTKQEFVQGLFGTATRKASVRALPLPRREGAIAVVMPGSRA